MARLARVVAPGIPHHITQRGNRRQPTFFCEADYETYLALMKQFCDYYGVEIWAYCLMSNHVHLIAVPDTEDALGLAIGEAHRRYTRHVNVRENWRGHLWQGRFASFPMDEVYLLAAARYVERNPVEAGMVKRAQDYPWSSARAHLNGTDDALVRADPLLDLVPNWKQFLSVPVDDQDLQALESSQRTGRPLGSETFIDTLESQLDRPLRPQKPGPKPHSS